MHKWLEQCDLIREPLLFSFLSEVDGAVSMSPIQGEAVIKRYMDGSSVRAYDFAIQRLARLSDTTDDTNTQNMYIQRQWADWIKDQQRIGNFPNFGSRCADYSLELLSNMPILSEQYPNGMGKYQFFARLNYREESDHG